MKRGLSPDGIEQTFAIDHLAYFLLTGLLLDVLKASAPARVVNVASAASAGGHIDFDDLELTRGYRGFRAYSNAKLANILFSNELARRVAGTGVTSNAVHPGVVATGFGRNDNGLFTLMVKLLRPFFISEESGARTSIHLATSPEVEGVTGKYFIKRNPRRPPREALDEAVARRLWDVSARMTGFSSP
jgi:NAD(P)-dependent dehydrogenase (short-subunit alcohol dehydrogenase family)